MMLKHCPFCGGKAEIVCCDEDCNICSDAYTEDPWNGLYYQIRHSHEENYGCPIAAYEVNGAIIGNVYMYETEEEAAKAWNTRVSEQEKLK